MTVRYYRWDDASAPTLTGQAGSLIALLDACLVTGYGAKSAAGWTKPYTGTNKAAFRPGAGPQDYLRVVNDGSVGSANVVGYEAMTDVDTGSNLFPTAGQAASGLYWAVSATTDATARPWIIVADASRMYLWVGASCTTANPFEASNLQHLHMFGAFRPFLATHQHYTFIIGYTDNTNAGRFGAIAVQLGPMAGASSGHFVARDYTNVVGSIAVNKATDHLRSNGTVLGANISANQYPDPVTGGFLLGKLYVLTTAAFTVLGDMPGVWAPLHNLAASRGDTFSGSGEMVGRSFINLGCTSNTTAARVVLEISDTWDV